MSIVSTSMEGTLTKGNNYRVRKVDNYSRNQIIAFRVNDPYFGEQTWVFRLVGVPGDIVEIKQGKLYVNGKTFEEPDKLKFSYHVSTKGLLNPKAIEGMEYEESGLNEFIFYITEREKEKLSKNSNIINIKSKIQMPGVYQKGLFESDPINKWNTDNYGPVKIPDDNEIKHFFVLGDNRHNAVDSRYIGLILESDVLGLIENE